VAVLRWNSGATRVGVMREELGKLRGAEVELMRGLAGAGVRRSGRSTAEQKARCGGARGDGVGARWRLRCGAIEPGKVRGAKLKGRLGS
jgi:hypothetical protein